MNPVRSISSQLTTDVLTFRNPKDADARWMQNAIRIDHLYLHIPKVLLAEVACTALLATATVETLVYSSLWLSSLPFYFYSDAALHYFGNLCNSAAFTIVWNFSNVIVINPFLTHAHADESCARFVLDHWERGNVVRTLLMTMEVTIITLSLLTKQNSRYFLLYVPSDLIFRQIRYTRTQDLYYLTVRYANFANNQRRAGIPHILHDDIARLVASNGEETMQAGARFIQDSILQQVDESTKNTILEMDPAIFHFIAARTVFLYIFDAQKRSENPPAFLKPITQNHIIRLRRQFSLDRGNTLATLMRDFKQYSYDPQANYPLNDPEAVLQLPDEATRNRLNELSPETRALLNRIKEAASYELQSSIFTRGCFQRALEENALNNTD